MFLARRDGCADGLAGADGLDELAVAHCELSANEDVADAGGEPRGILKGGLVADLGGVEDGEVGVGTDADAAFIQHRRDTMFEAHGGHEGHLADGVHQAERLFFADIFGKDAREGSGGAGVALAFDDVEAIGSNHRKRAQDGVAHVLFGVGMNDHNTGLLAVLEEGVAGKALAGGTPLQRPIVGGELIDPGIEEGRLNAGGTGGIGVGFCRDVEATGTGIADELQETRGRFVTA